MASQALIKEFEDLLGKENVFSSEADRQSYSYDSAVLPPVVPAFALRPTTTEQLGICVKKLYDYGIPMTVRGAGTNLSGGTIPDSKESVVILTNGLNRILEINSDDLYAVVEPGVVTATFAAEVAKKNLFYPPDPGEKTATMGGNAMTNAGGMRAVRYGVTRDYVLGMEVVLASGEVINLGGKNVKTSSGYSLIDLMVGSEGTLGFLTKLTVKLIPEPKVNLSLLMPFDDLDACIGAVPAVLGCGCEPTAVEFMEREVIACAETYLGKQFPDTSADAYLLVRLDDPSAEALKPAMDQLTDLALSIGAKDVLLADTDERKESIWNARGAFLEAIKGSTPEMDECDVVVPREDIPAFVRKSVEIGRKIGVRICSFGHAGDGNLHIYACKDDLADEVWEKAVEQVMDELYIAAKEMGGEVSGEHGIGHAKKGFLAERMGETQMNLMRGIKAAFDPKGILNPGKVV